MDPQPEAESKIQRIDKSQSKRMQIEEEEVVRARYLMSPFNVNEAYRHQRQQRAAAWVIAGVILVGAATISYLVWFR